MWPEKEELDRSTAMTATGSLCGQTDVERRKLQRKKTKQNTHPNLKHSGCRNHRVVFLRLPGHDHSLVPQDTSISMGRAAVTR